MPTNENLIPIPGRLHSVANEGHVAGANEIYDDDQQKLQSEINADVKVMGASGENHSKGLVPDPGATQGVTKYLCEDGTWKTPPDTTYESEAAAEGGTTVSLVTTGDKYNWNQKADKASVTAGDYNKVTVNSEGIVTAGSNPTTLAGHGITDAYTKAETYTKTEVNNLVDTPHQEYVTVATYASLPATGSKDTIYRVSNYNGSTSQVDATSYSEYAWNGSSYIFLCVKSQTDEVFDITAYNSNTKYADISAALGVDGANVPQTLRKGGMSIKFVQNSDNKYVQYRLISQNFSTTPSDWIGMNVGTDLMNIFVGASIQDVSIEDYADDHSYILYGNLTLYVNQAYNTKVCYFPINKYGIYHIDIPKTGNGYMAIACYCSSIITSGNGFSPIRDINSQEIGEGTDSQYSFDYKASDNGYLAIVYNTSAATPVCTLKKSSLSERVSKLEEEKISVDFDFNNIFDVTNYGLFVDIIARKKYNENGVLVNDSNYNATSLTYLDRNNDIVICNITYNNRIVFFDKEMNFIDYIDGGYAYNVISKNNFPQNAMYVAFSYPTNTDTGALFSTRQESVMWLSNNLTIKSSIKKIRGSRPKIFIYVNDTEAEILFKLVDAYLTKDCDVYWESGTYTFSDIFIDMADEYGIGRVGGAWERELPIGGNCRYYFNNSIIIGNCPSSLADTKVFGTMRLNIGNYELHDVTIISNDMTYCIHDEANGVDGTYIHGYYNCKMVSNKTSKAVRCIGGGTGKHGVAIIDNCVFEGVDNITDVAYHGIANSAVTDVCDFVVNIKNSYFKYGAQVNTLSTNQSGRLVYCGNSAIVAPNVLDGWTSTQWNNELRN